jgi:AcrR family transcriptional regulator
MPRVGLDREAVVTAAAELANEAGLDALTIAALSQRLGVRAPSLYAHVAGVDDLRRRVAARTITTLARRLQAAVAGRSGRDALAALAAEFRVFAQEQRGAYAAVQRLPAPDDEQGIAAAEQLYAVVAAVIRGYGIEGAEAVHAIRSVRAALHGFVSLEAGGGFGMPVDLDESFERLVAALDAGLTAFVPAGEEPRTRP